MSEISSFFFINLDTKAKGRYNLEKFLNYVNGNHDALTSSILYRLREIEIGGHYRVQGEEARPDLISYRVYDDTQYWWVIMLYNSITSVEQIENGMEIQYPRLDLLDDFYFSLKFNQDSE